jgi:DNA-binding MarR family transcriptional regulator
MNAVLQADRADAESGVSDTDDQSLRLWLRLLTCTTMIERNVRERMRMRFDITLPRFELMAQLAGAPKGLRMSDLSRRLMVTGGNVTGLTDQLVAERLVVRGARPGDRRVYTVRLTARGRRQLELMKVEHDRWITDLLAGVPVEEREALHHLLGVLKAGVANALDAVVSPVAAIGGLVGRPEADAR